MSKAAELANLIGNINAGGGGVNRNLIINGAMNVAQRGTSFNQPADGAYTLDRFSVFRNGAGIMDVEQSTTVPSEEGFKNSLKCTVDTVDTSLGSSDFGGLATKIEGQDLARFHFGKSTAKQFVLSFFVRSNVTGTYSVSFRNGSANRYLVKEYTISSADTWQKITITNLADNTGTWATDNTSGLHIVWCLWEGGYSAPADTWGTGNIIGSSSNVNWVSSTDNNFYLTGVQFEVGQNSTEFEHEPFAVTHQKCQRYCQIRIGTDGANGATAQLGIGNARASTAAYFQDRLQVKMRTAPSLTVLNATNFYLYQTGAHSVTALGIDTSDANNMLLVANVSSGLTSPTFYTLGANNANAKCIYSSEL